MGALAAGDARKWDDESGGGAVFQPIFELQQLRWDVQWWEPTADEPVWNATGLTDGRDAAATTVYQHHPSIRHGQ